MVRRRLSKKRSSPVFGSHSVRCTQKKLCLVHRASPWTTAVKVVTKKREALAEMPEDILTCIYTHVFVADGSVPGMVSVNKTFRRQFMPMESIKLNLKPRIIAAKALCLDVLLETRNINAVNDKLIEDEFWESPESTPNTRAMDGAVRDAESDEAEALLELKAFKNAKCLWWAPPSH